MEGSRGDGEPVALQGRNWTSSSAVTLEGVAIVERLRESGRIQLEALPAGWSPERNSEMAPRLGRPSIDLVSQSPQDHTFW